MEIWAQNSEKSIKFKERGGGYNFNGRKKMLNSKKGQKNDQKKFPVPILDVSKNGNE